MKGRSLLAINAAAMFVAFLALLWLSRPFSLYVQGAAVMVGCGAVAAFVAQMLRDPIRRRRELRAASEEREGQFRRLRDDPPRRRSGDTLP